MGVSWLPLLLALAAGVLFGFNVFVQGRALRGADGLTGAFLSVGGMAAMLWLLAPFMIRLDWFATGAAALFLAVGLFFPAAGQGFQIAAVGRVGPALTSAIGSFTPVFAVVPAVLLLDERLGLQGALALALMIAGLSLSAIGRRGVARGWPLWALLLPLAAAAARGIVQPALKVGLTDLPSPFFAALVTATTSTAVLGLMVRWRAGRAPAAIPHDPRALGLFAASGVINGLGILSLNAAISLGEVTLVSPLVALAPFWSLLFGVLLFRGERVTARLVLVAALVVGGAVLLVTR
ncbi:DMT family transporter [Psychromarinibacter sp. C21-152]|uniref:DMT family transporter n=1 Tax=Psychromarinibacter sediminicola TaxID=3033385 RepID=A0AAE3NQR5_9RHOB|nr:DMT family transporter [Psychromarinibacter sediminicola]MDF0601798.1 DMT family transporter [Psychromarinibacter sediminicola]